MTKDEARQVALQRWRELPIANQLLENAADFAQLLAPTIDFHTVGDKEKIIAAWLVVDVEARKTPSRI